MEGTKPLPEPMLTYSQSAHNKQASVKLEAKYNNFLSGKRIQNYHLQNKGHFVEA